MTDPSLYRDDSRVRHMLDAIWDILQHDIPDEYTKVKEIAATLPPEPTQLPPNMADFL